MSLIEGDINMQLDKILSKVMQNSYKRKEIEELIERISSKIHNMLSEAHKEDEIRSLRSEFENIRREFYNL